MYESLIYQKGGMTLKKFILFSVSVVLIFNIFITQGSGFNIKSPLSTIADTYENNNIDDGGTRG